MTYSSGDDRTLVIVTKMCVGHEFFIKLLNLRGHTCTQVSCAWLQSSPASDWLMWWLRDRSQVQGCFCSFTAQPSIFILQQLVYCPLTNMFNLDRVEQMSGYASWPALRPLSGAEAQLSKHLFALSRCFPWNKNGNNPLSTKKRSLHFCNFVVSAKEWRI